MGVIGVLIVSVLWALCLPNNCTAADTFTPTDTPTATETATATPTATATSTRTATATQTPRWVCVSIGTTPVLITTPLASCALTILANDGPLEIRLGDAIVTADGGLPLQPKDLLLLRREEAIRDDWWGVVAVGTCVVCVQCLLR
jgi:hypothetical protein